MMRITSDVETLKIRGSATHSAIKPIQILIVDDHEIIRRGLSALLKTNTDFELIGEAANGLQALEQCARLQPDIILMDIRMPHMDGLQATQRIRADYPNIRVIILTGSDDPRVVTSAMQAGAIGYLEKDISSEHLATAIRAAYQGNRTLSPAATQALVSAATEPPEPIYDLTEREADVLALMVKGLTNPEIARQLSVSRSTVKYHISAILAKLGVVNRSEAVAFALKNRLL